MPQPITVGVITNASGVHLGAYFTALAQAEEVGAVALSDPSGQCVESARTTLGKKLTSVHRDAAAMLRRAQPVMALVSLEAVAAPPAIDAALEAGSHVFAEKPACIRADDFDRLNRKADGKHLHLMLALANRLNPEVLEARRLIRSGAIGKLYGLEMHLIADQTRLTRPAYHQKWFAQKARAGGGHLAWLGLHWLDLAMYITEARVQQVTGFAGNVGGQPLDVEDSAAVVMRFDNDTFGTLTSGYYTDKGYHSHIKIWGSLGWLHVDTVAEPALTWYSTKDGKQAEVHTYDGPTGPKGYTPFVRAAVRASAGLADPPITGAESLRVLQTVFAFYTAATTGTAQPVG